MRSEKQVNHIIIFSNISESQSKTRVNSRKTTRRLVISLGCQNIKANGVYTHENSSRADKSKKKAEEIQGEPSAYIYIYSCAARCIIFARHIVSDESSSPV